MNNKLARFRLIAEMDNGEAFGVKLTDEQTEKLTRVLENILGGKAQVHETAFAKNIDLFPEVATILEDTPA